MRGLLFSLALLAAGAHAAELKSVDVTHEKGVYRMTSVTVLDAPLAGVFDVLTDYDDFERISSVYDDAHFLPRLGDDPVRVYTRVKGCVWFYCQTLERVEILTNEGLTCLRTEAIPDASDFKSSVSTWTLREVEGGTEVTYSILMEPDFFVPPLIGPYVLKRRLRSGGTDAIARMERFANASDRTPKDFAARGLVMREEQPQPCAEWFAASAS